jgi:hypothetical protein
VSQRQRYAEPERQPAPAPAPAQERAGQPGPAGGEAVQLRRAAAGPGQAGRVAARLQRAYGNRSLARAGQAAHAAAGAAPVVQAKLVVTPAGDRYEQEADRLADAALSGQSAGGASGQPAPALSRIQRAGGEGGGGEGGMAVDTASEAGIAAARGGGAALPDGVRAPLEGALGHDLRAVRVHTDARADALSGRLAARAFTTGADVFFRQGEYAPERPAGYHLLAHELAHVVQQGGGTGAVQRGGDEEGKKSPPPSEVPGLSFSEQLLAQIESHKKRVLAQIESHKKRVLAQSPRAREQSFEQIYRDRDMERRRDWEQLFAQIHRDMERSVAQIYRDMESRSDWDQPFAQIHRDTEQSFAQIQRDTEQPFAQIHRDMEQSFAQIQRDTESSSVWEQLFAQIYRDTEWSFAQIHRDMERRRDWEQLFAQVRRGQTAAAAAASSSAPAASSQQIVPTEKVIPHILKFIFAGSGQEAWPTPEKEYAKSDKEPMRIVKHMYGGKKYSKEKHTQEKEELVFEYAGPLGEFLMKSGARDSGENSTVANLNDAQMEFDKYMVEYCGKAKTTKLEAVQIKIKGFSRGAATASVFAKGIKMSRFRHLVHVNLVLIDPVHGTGMVGGGLMPSEVDVGGIYDEKNAPDTSGTTYLMPITSDHPSDWFTPQMIRGYQRIIIAYGSGVKHSFGLGESYKSTLTIGVEHHLRAQVKGMKLSTLPKGLFVVNTADMEIVQVRDMEHWKSHFKELILGKADTTEKRDVVIREALLQFFGKDN